MLDPLQSAKEQHKNKATFLGVRFRLGIDLFKNQRRNGDLLLKTQKILGGGFKHFLFSPLFGEDFQFDENIFQMGWFNHQLDHHVL